VIGAGANKWVSGKRGGCRRDIRRVLPALYDRVASTLGFKANKIASECETENSKLKTQNL
jgi:hypothetical protein